MLLWDDRMDWGNRRRKNREENEQASSKPPILRIDASTCFHQVGTNIFPLNDLKQLTTIKPRYSCRIFHETMLCTGSFTQVMPDIPYDHYRKNKQDQQVVIKNCGHATVTLWTCILLDGGLRYRGMFLLRQQAPDLGGEPGELSLFE